MQVFLLFCFFLFFSPAQKPPQSIQLEIWMYFLVAFLFPFILYAVSSFSLVMTNPFQYFFHLLILVTFPTAVLLGLLSFRYFSWSKSLFHSSPVDVSVERLQILKALFVILLLATLFMAQVTFYDTSLVHHTFLFINGVCMLFPMLAHYLNYTGYR